LRHEDFTIEKKSRLLYIKQPKVNYHRLKPVASGFKDSRDQALKGEPFLITLESGSERIPRSLLRGKRANGEHYYSLWIEDSPQFTAESFNPEILNPLERKRLN